MLRISIYGTEDRLLRGVICKMYNRYDRSDNLAGYFLNQILSHRCPFSLQSIVVMDEIAMMACSLAVVIIIKSLCFLAWELDSTVSLSLCFIQSISISIDIAVFFDCIPKYILFLDFSISNSFHIQHRHNNRLLLIQLNRPHISINPLRSTIYISIIINLIQCNIIPINTKLIIFK